MARRVVILGNGIAGITAARHVRKRDPEAEIVVISGETDRFFSRTALMYIYMGHMTFRDTQPYEERFWDDNRIECVRGWVERVDVAAKTVVFDDGADLAYDALLLATGSVSNRFGWPGQDLRAVQGLYSYPDLLQMEEDTRGVERGVVVGGGLIGVETAEMLHSRGIAATLLVREASWMDFAFPAEESAMLGEEIRAHGVDLRLATELESIEDDGSGRACAVRTKGGGERIPCGFVALTVGVRPNVDFLADSGIEIDRGILVDARLRTSAPDVYAAGDCAQLRDPAPGRRPIEAVWYAGRAMGETVARTLCGEPTDYDQGIWFNSAKFFDLEWQVYGLVPPQPPAGEADLFWRHPRERRSIRIRYREDDLAVTGFNLLGVRYRHELCHAWIRDARPLPEVLADLSAANFDPELFPQYEGELRRLYNARHPDRPPVAPRGRLGRGWRAFLRATGAS